MFQQTNEIIKGKFSRKKKVTSALLDTDRSIWPRKKNKTFEHTKLLHFDNTSTCDFDNKNYVNKSYGKKNMDRCKPNLDFSS